MVRLIVCSLIALGLAGCFGDGRPVDDYLRDEARYADAEVPTGTDDAAVAVEEFPPPTCSMDGGGSAQVTFQNETDRVVEVRWVDGACNERAYQTLNPTASYTQPTFMRHAWRVRDAVTHEILLDFPGVEAAGTNLVVIR